MANEQAGTLTEKYTINYDQDYYESKFYGDLDSDAGQHS